MKLSLSKKNSSLQGEIRLNASKSISNRLLIIQALCKEDFVISNLSNAQDSISLNQLLNNSNSDQVFDAGAAGTTYRFLTAYLALQKGTQILTGSERMKKRPIGILVEALKTLGANIKYLENDGYPPLEINSPNPSKHKNDLKIPANISSQYISALLLIAPVLPNGLNLELDGKIVSQPYIEMTLKLMSEFGISYSFEDNQICIPTQQYKPKDITVESDWSAASYFYSMAAIADHVDLVLHGLDLPSLQGDAAIAQIMEKFSVKTETGNGYIRLTKDDSEISKYFEYDFTECPDLAQTVAITAAALGIKAKLTGLSTLKIKETDRILALKNELEKFELEVIAGPDELLLSGQTTLKHQSIKTYEDHRMAMAFAPLALLGEISIEESDVVKKSYPAFWIDLKKLGFEISNASKELL